MIQFLLWADGLLLAGTFGIFLLQGFKAWGFNLNCGLMQWLGGATVGGVGGLLTLAYGAVFKEVKN